LNEVFTQLLITTNYFGSQLTSRTLSKQTLFSILSKGCEHVISDLVHIHYLE